MIVKDEQTRRQAIELMKSGSVTYSDANMFKVIEDQNELQYLLGRQISTGDIAIVSLRSSSDHENYEYSLKAVKRERRIDEQRAVRQWVSDNPVKARRMANSAARAIAMEKAAHERGLVMA